MTIERQARILFVVNALTKLDHLVAWNVDPVGIATAFSGVAPNYPFVIRLWSAFIFMFGCMFWQTSRDVVGRRVLIKYNWIEKTLTATASSHTTISRFDGGVRPERHPTCGRTHAERTDRCARPDREAI